MSRCVGFAITLQYLYTKSWLPHVSFMPLLLFDGWQ